ncbi:hypothetical protein F3Y22_tig00002841pilonHSYRG00192 [Hibiscus syriacus]|uniref:Uncharacterized protein n=1 Tax=Hibiscus syriacus TaxID=106335 RepID=A0A6A3CQ40_HIBSY|nr:hypothetical protein F3Y22_tig00002841pilonHSYRG00192 [Hibiscus syriacus]
MMSSGRDADARGMNIDEKKKTDDIESRIGSAITEEAKAFGRFETVALGCENKALKVQQMELAQYLRKLELLQFNLVNQTGRSFGDQIVEPPKVRSWQCHGSNQPAIMASTEMLNY